MTLFKQMIRVIYIKQKQSSAKFRIIYPIDNLNDYSSNLSGDHFRFWNKKRNLSPDFIALEIITSLFKDFCRGNDPYCESKLQYQQCVEAQPLKILIKQINESHSFLFLPTMSEVRLSNRQLSIERIYRLPWFYFGSRQVIHVVHLSLSNEV